MGSSQPGGDATAAPGSPGLAIFPLGTVLFPGGAMPLRVFEARYMDMVRDCMQRGAPFGVCLITRGKEVGEAADHEDIGCLATITDWDMQQLGLLQIRVRGGGRFRIVARRLQSDGLIRADVEMIEPDPAVPVPQEHAICVNLVRRIVDDLEKREPSPVNRMVLAPYDFDSAAWVGNRLCEFLPITARARQKLMELPDPLARLSLVHQYLKQHGVV